MTRAQSFAFFLEHFSIEDLPLILSDDNIGYFDTKNRVLSPDLIRRFILQGKKEEEEDDEFTEYIACCKIPDTEKFHGIVYWKGSMLSYDFILATYDKNGVLLHQKAIAGIRSDGKNVVKSVATIEADWIINIITGAQLGKEELYDPQKSQMMSMEIMANGEIIFSLNNE